MCSFNVRYQLPHITVQSTVFLTLQLFEGFHKSRDKSFEDRSNHNTLWIAGNSASKVSCVTALTACFTANINLYSSGSFMV